MHTAFWILVDLKSFPNSFRIKKTKKVQLWYLLIDKRCWQLTHGQKEILVNIFASHWTQSSENPSDDFSHQNLSVDLIRVLPERNSDKNFWANSSFKMKVIEVFLKTRVQSFRFRKVFIWQLFQYEHFWVESRSLVKRSQRRIDWM